MAFLLCSETIIFNKIFFWTYKILLNYEDEQKVRKWQHWLAYCQFRVEEMSNGTALELIERWDIR